MNDAPLPAKIEGQFLEKRDWILQLESWWIVCRLTVNVFELQKNVHLCAESHVNLQDVCHTLQIVGRDIYEGHNIF